jgi:hypothetical protein
MRILVVLALLAICQLARPETVVLTSVADTTLFEFTPNNNQGAFTNFAAGTTGIVTEGAKSRGLVQFDVAASVPANAQITAVRVHLTVIRVPGGGGVSSTFGLHRVLQPWNEGNKVGFATGVPATAGETTWNSRLHGSALWTTPGGAPDADYAAEASSRTMILGLGTYTFDTSAAAVADAQTWLGDPAINYGWIVISEDEETQQTARRFGSRESPPNAPRLEIEYAVPYRITRYDRTNSTFRLFFPVEPQFQYTVQFNTNLTAGGWTVLTNFIERFTAYEGVAVDSTTRNTQNFYRLVKEPL